MSIVLVLEIAIFILLNVHKSNGELFTSIIEVKRLLYTHENVLSNLNQYVLEEDRRLRIIQR